MTSNWPSESRSQALQDIFVLAVSDKRCGFFLEIGGFHSEKLSNTYLLEKSFGWRGVTVEYLPENAAEISSNRSAAVICEDARTVRWSEKKAAFGIPLDLDYLQVDCEPSLSSLIALWRVVASGLRPRIVTFEHDAYAASTLFGVIPQGRSVRWVSRVLLKGLGYSLVAANVCTRSGKPFEDWWVFGSPASLQRMAGSGMTHPAEFLRGNGLLARYERLAADGSGDGRLGGLRKA